MKKSFDRMLESYSKLDLPVGSTMEQFDTPGDRAARTAAWLQTREEYLAALRGEEKK